jgi:hypothetical protein
MSTFNQVPFFFQITWNNSSPNSFTNLPGNQAGGIDCVAATPDSYNRRVSVTGTVSITGTPLSTGASIVINNTTIPFTNADTLSTIIVKINNYAPLTHVVAYATGNYLTLTNALDQLGFGISVLDGTVPTLALLGISAGYYNGGLNTYGTVSNPTVSTGDNLIINNSTITFVSGNLISISNQINNSTSATGVAALPAGNVLQLTSTVGPWSLSGSAAAELGFTPGYYGGMPSQLSTSQNKTLANGRFQQVINQLEFFTSPSYVGNYFSTGNYDGNSDVSTFTFTVGYNDIDQVQTIDELSTQGNVLVGAAAVTRFVSRGLAANNTYNAKVFDPTLAMFGNLVARPDSVRIVNTTVGPISSNLIALEQNITVTQIAI